MYFINLNWLQLILRTFCFPQRNRNSNAFEKSTFSQTESHILDGKEEVETQYSNNCSKLKDDIYSQNIMENNCKSLISSADIERCDMSKKLSKKYRHISRRILRDVILHFPEVEDSIMSLTKNIIVELCDGIIREEIIIYRDFLTSKRLKYEELLTRPCDDFLDKSLFSSETFDGGPSCFNNLYKNLKTKYKAPIQNKYVVPVFKQKNKKEIFTIGPSIVKRYTIKKYRIFDTKETNTISEINEISCDIVNETVEKAPISDNSVLMCHISVSSDHSSTNEGQCKGRNRGDGDFSFNVSRDDCKQLSDKSEALKQLNSEHEVIKIPNKESSIVLDFKLFNYSGHESEDSENINTTFSTSMATNNDMKLIRLDLLKSPVSIAIPLDDQSNMKIRISSENLIDDLTNVI